MEFCDRCQNMFYFKLDDDKNLIRYCKNCKNQKTNDKKNGSVLIIKDNKIDANIKYSQFINSNVKYDPTLPHVSNIKCPNINCIKKNSEKNDVIYLKYDFDNMMYIYTCNYCDKFWTLDTEESHTKNS